MSIYDDMQSLAREVMAEFAQGSLFLLSVTAGTGPIDEPGKPVETPHEIDGAARGVQFKYVQNGLADAADSQVTFSVKPDIPKPKQGDFMLIDGRKFKVMQVVAKPQAGTPVAYTVIVRR